MRGPYSGVRPPDRARQNRLLAGDEMPILFVEIERMRRAQCGEVERAQRAKGAAAELHDLYASSSVRSMLSWCRHRRRCDADAYAVPFGPRPHRTARCPETSWTSGRTTSPRRSRPCVRGRRRRDGCSARTRRARGATRNGHRRRYSFGSRDRAAPPRRPRSCSRRHAFGSRRPGARRAACRQARAAARSRSARSAASPRRAGGPCRATSRSAPCCAHRPIQRCPQELRAVAVHTHLARRSFAGPRSLRSGEERVGRLRITRREDQRCRPCPDAGFGQEKSATSRAYSGSASAARPKV